MLAGFTQWIWLSLSDRPQIGCFNRNCHPKPGKKCPTSRDAGQLVGPTGPSPDGPVLPSKGAGEQLLSCKTGLLEIVSDLVELPFRCHVNVSLAIVSSS